MKRPATKKPRKPAAPATNATTFEVVEPRASALIESLRAFGYSIRTAIADLVDNSIAANAQNIELRTVWAGEKSYIVLIDDGRGMSQAELINAMRPGSKSPTEVRDPSDLGRFGLGLKTASFSQCRRLTVWSKRSGGRPVARCWDLDYVCSSQEWRLLSELSDSTQQIITSLKKPDHGTIVVWEKMDRLVGESSVDDPDAKSHFHDAVDEVQAHLSMVFHRFMAKPTSLSLYVNGTGASHRLAPWDPFLTVHSATQVLPAERLQIGEDVTTVEAFILPHHDKLDKKEHKNAAGPSGWNAQQGFYVYRNNRLLVPGSWLNLGFTKEEHHKLARIAVDFPSTLDHAWHIDVKKSAARPPRQIRRRLRQLADIARKRAVEVYRHRDPLQPRKGAEPTILIWRSAVRADKTIYQINREHPLVQACLTEAGEAEKPLLALLRLIEETVPVHHIWLDSAQDATSAAIPFEGIKDPAILPIIRSAYLALRKNGHSPEQARAKLMTFEGLTHFSSQIKQLTDSNCGV